MVQPGSKGEEHGIAAALLTALPFGTAASSMLLCAKHSQATGAARPSINGRGLLDGFRGIVFVLLCVMSLLVAPNS